MNHSFENLGARPRPKDKRDFGLAAYQEPVAIPEAYTTDLTKVPVYYQGKYGTCGAHAGAVLNSQLQDTPLSPKYLWRQIKLIDSWTVDEGTDLRSIMKSLAGTGDCTLDLSPNDLEDDVLKYTDAKQITEEQLTDAAKRRVTGYAFANSPSFEEIKRAIYLNKTVILLLACGDGWWRDANGKGSWAAKDVLPLKLGNYASGHFVVAYGYDKDFVYFRNSWSESWGAKGNGYFDSSYVQHIRELGTALKLPARFIFKNNLWLGSTGNDVLELQKRLGMDYSTGPGIFGPRTLAAVVKYQKANGIYPTLGYVGALTRASLNKS